MYFLDMDDKPCLNDNGYAGVKSQYDEKNQEIRHELFGIDGKPCTLGKDNPFTGWEKSYYENGAISKKTLFCTVKPYKGVLGKWIEDYDEHGNITMTCCMDMNDQPCLCDGGYAGVKSQYDEKNQEIRHEYFGIDGKPCARDDEDDPLTGWEKTFHENGKIAKQTWFYPIKPYKGVLGKSVDEFDEFGNKISTCFLDLNDQPCLCNEGYAKVTMKYEKYAASGFVLTEMAYFGIDNKPCLCKIGFAKITIEYDNNGNIIKRAIYDAQGQKIPL